MSISHTDIKFYNIYIMFKPWKVTIESDHWFLPDDRIVVQIVDVDINDRTLWQCNSVDSQLIFYLSLDEWNWTVKSH